MPRAKAATPQPAANPTTIAIDKLIPNPFNARRSIDSAEIDDLAASITVHGLLSPLVVRAADEDGNHLVISGHRRLVALERARRKEAPCLVLDVDDATAAAIGLVENIQRVDLTEYELALAIRAMREALHMRNTQIAKRIGKSEAYVTRAFEILKLPGDALALIEDGSLSSAQAAQIAKLGDWPAVANAVAEYTVQTQTPAAEYTVQTQTPAAELARVSVPFARDLANAGKIAALHQSRGYVKDICTLCPFNAYRSVGRGQWQAEAYCLNPTHEAELALAWEREQEEKRRTALEAARAANSIATPGPIQQFREDVAAHATVDDDDEYPRESDIPCANCGQEVTVHNAAEDRRIGALITSGQGHRVLCEDCQAQATQDEAQVDEEHDEPAPPAPPDVDPRIPSVQHLPWESYSRLTTPVEGCSEACACRGKALDYNNVIVDICTEPKRRRGLESAATRARNKVLKSKAEEVLAITEGQIDAIGNPAPEDVALIVMLAVRSVGIGTSNDAENAANRYAQNLKGAVWRNWSIDPNLINELARLPVRAQVQFALAAITNNESRQPPGARPLTHWWLQQKGADVTV